MRRGVLRLVRRLQVLRLLWRQETGQKVDVGLLLQRLLNRSRLRCSGRRGQQGRLGWYGRLGRGRRAGMWCCR